MDLRTFGIGLLVTGLLLTACEASDQGQARLPSPGTTPRPTGTTRAVSTTTPAPGAGTQAAATIGSPPAAIPASPRTLEAEGTREPTAKSPAGAPLRPMRIEPAFPNLMFRRLTNLVQPDDEGDRIFVTEQGGRVLVFPDRQQAAESQVFLDISGRIRVKDNKEGLLVLAFNPRFKETCHFYVYYSASDPRRLVISRFSANAERPNTADADTELVILEILQPYGNHNGGQLAFGPEGYL